MRGSYCGASNRRIFTALRPRASPLCRFAAVQTKTRPKLGLASVHSQRSRVLLQRAAHLFHRACLDLADALSGHAELVG